MLSRHFSGSSLRAAGSYRAQCYKRHRLTPAGTIDLSRAIEGADNQKPRAPKQESGTQDHGAPSFRITRQAVDSPRAPRSPSSPSQGKAPGQVLLRRSAARSPVDPQRVIARRTDTPTTRPTGTVLARRTGPPRTGAPSPSGSRLPQRDPRRGPASNNSSSNNNNTHRKRGPTEDQDNTFDEYVEDDEDSPLRAYENQLAASEANNGLPTEPIAYSPAEQTLEELRKDWPDTPLSATGLTEAVVQKFRWLARDLPHGYWTPRQIAERFVSGGLVRFEDEEHKAKVMVWVERMLAERQVKMEGWAEKKGVELSGIEKGDEAEKAIQRFMAVEKNASWQALVDSLVKGHYPELPTGQRPLIASVQRQLRNNESYGAVDTSKLIGRISSLIGSLQSQAAQQRAAAGQKEAA